MTLKILDSMAYIEGHVDTVSLARFKRPTDISAEQWHTLATTWGAAIMGAVLAVKEKS